MKCDILNHIKETKIVAILRGINSSKVIEAVKALQNGGVKTVEVTLDSEEALESIKIIKRKFKEDILVGAGTVLDAETTRLSILSGADFILSPILSLNMIKVCNRYSKLSVPGVFTPTEIMQAWQQGSELVKVFPANTLGPGYLKDIKGPLKHINLMPVGGINKNNAKQYIENGAFALGVGSNLVNKELVFNDEFEIIEKKARDLVDSIKI